MKGRKENRTGLRCGFLFWAALALFFLCAQPAPAGETVLYRDPDGRFTFEYPKAWGQVTVGTNDGFGGRVAARKFSEGPGGRLGGEAVLTRGRVMVDLQALGGLYDAISLEMLPPAIAATVNRELINPGAKNFCDLLGQESHLNLTHPNLKKLNPQVRSAIIGLDHTRNVKPQVIQCVRQGDTVTFHKATTFRAGAVEARQHVYGAIRFLRDRFSSFQLVLGDTRPPAGETLSTLTAVVKSLRLH